QSTRKLDQEDMRNFRRFHLSHRVSNGAIIRLELDDNHEWQIQEKITSHLSGLRNTDECQQHEEKTSHLDDLRNIHEHQQYVIITSPVEELQELRAGR
ncbi:MAG TPA: hypothetical protein VNE38_20210, partial [Ktedonobacteraceae bacterium]|nr:hypothetical protein [Ktedonobacteraceae bacterium]